MEGQYLRSTPFLLYHLILTTDLSNKFVIWGLVFAPISQIRLGDLQNFVQSQVTNDEAWNLAVEYVCRGRFLIIAS